MIGYVARYEGGASPFIVSIGYLLLREHLFSKFEQTTAYCINVTGKTILYSYIFVLFWLSSQDQTPYTLYLNKNMNSILKVISVIIIPVLLMLAAYVQLHGEISPGGGFQAGVIMAAGFVLLDLSFNSNGTRKIFPKILLVKLSAIGVMIYLLVGILPVLTGNVFFEVSKILKDKPVLSHEIGISIIELGVGLTVFSSVLLLYTAFNDLLRSTKNVK